MNYFLILLCGVIVNSLSIILFSYTQVDLSLTLSEQSLLRDIQTLFQQIGFFNRTWASAWFIALLISIFVLWAGILLGINKKQLNLRQVILLILVQSGLLFFSYPAAFSYDIFNYIFTAKTVAVYQTNPYQVLPVSFQGIDPMLSFMRWTHLPSAYTPLWIGLTVPFFLLSGNVLILALFTIKILPVFAYLASCYLLYQIQKSQYPDNRLLSLSLFAFNPLIMVESLVSAHNDIVMMAFALAAFYFSIKHANVLSFLLWSFSVATKLMTFPLGLLYLFGWGRRAAVVLLALGLGIVLSRREFLPWYAVWVIPFSALIIEVRWLQYSIAGLSAGLLLRYLPVLYTGTYTSQGRLFQDSVTIFFPILFLVIFSLYSFVKRKKKGIISI